MTSIACWTSFSRCAMSESNVSACPVCVMLLFLSIECVLLSCLLVRLPVCAIFCCALVPICAAYSYAFWLGVYVLSLCNDPPSEVMVWIIGLFEESAAS